MKPDEPGKTLNKVRGVFGILAAIFALITFITFGANMDFANFPGSNLKLAVYPDGHEKEGKLKEVLGGYELETIDNIGCTNFVEDTNTATDASALDFTNVATDDQKLCKANDDSVEKNRIKEWSDGWIVVPDCKRTLDENECAPFGASSPLAWFGFLTFGTLAIQVVLYGAHTCVLLVNDAKLLINEAKVNDANLLINDAKDKDAKKSSILKKLPNPLEGYDRNSKIWLGLTIVWTIIGFALMATAAFAWDSMCDKIDTGLGRQVSDASGTKTRACATSTCTTSFGSFFATMVFALVWYRLPDIAQWFGFLESN